MDLNYHGISGLAPVLLSVTHQTHEIFRILEEKLNGILFAGDCVAKQNQLIGEFVDFCCSYKPANFNEYVGYAAIAVGIALLQNRSPAMFELKSQLLSHAFDANVFYWSKDVENIAVVARTIWAVSSNVSNIKYIVTMISGYNRFTFHVGFVLVWAALTETLVDSSQRNRPHKEFCMHKVDKILDIIQKIKGIEDEADQVKETFDFLSLYSIYQGMVLDTRMPHNYGGDDFNEYFTYKLSDLESIRDFMRELSRSLNRRIQKNDHISECILMVQLLEFDILCSLDNLLAKDS